MKFNIYTAWMDPIFYAAAAIFAVSLFSLVYSIRRYVELTNSDEFDETPAEDPLSDTWPGLKTGVAAIPPEEQPGPVTPPSVSGSEWPAEAGQAGDGVTAPEAAGTIETAAPDQPLSQPDFSPAAPPRAPADSGSNRAETFVRGIYEELSGVDARLKNIEASVSKSRVNNDFTVKFLEDILSDLDALDKEKIKARIEYLLFDLRAHNTII